MRSDHLPFPMPERPHSLIQEWRDLTFLHWEVDPNQLAAYIPDGLEIDLFEGKAYVGTIPFMMKNIRPRLTIPLPGISNFPEFNVRTYVKRNGKSGILFLTLDAKSRITCFYAPRAYGLPYNYSKGKVIVQGESHRWNTIRPDGTHSFSGFCSPIGPENTPQPNSIEEFLFEKYCLYVTNNNHLFIAHVQHEPWVYRGGEVTILENDLTDSFDLGITDSLKPDLVHMSKGVKVFTWSNERVGQ